MVRRLLSLVVLLWLFGFLWFAVALPRGVSAGGPEARTDAVLVLTGGKGRIERGVNLLERGLTRRLLVSGVDRAVTPREFQAEYGVPGRLMACCLTLGFAAYDTRSNANEAVRWIALHRVRSLRIVTSDWHMRRARFELGRRLPRRLAVTYDAVWSEPSLRILFVEYNKLLLRWLSTLWQR